MSLISKVKIEIEGKEVANFVEWRLNQSIYGHHEFEVVFRKENFEDANKFPIDISQNFIAKVITIEVEAFTERFKESKPTLFFKGIITEVRAVRSSNARNDRIYLAGYSADILMQDNPGSCSFNGMNLRQIIDKVMSPLPKDLVRCKCNPESTGTYPYIVQYNESRYDFIRRLATRYGEWCFYNGRELHFGPLPNQSVDLVLDVDLTDFDFSIGLNPINTKYVSYNPSTGEPVESATNKSSGSNHLNDYGKKAHDQSMRLFSQQSVRLYNHLNAEGAACKPESQKVVDLTSSGIAMDMAAARGASSNSQIALGGRVVIKAIKTDGKGQVDFGEYILTSITHSCDHLNNYKNEFTCIPSKAKVPDYTDPLAFPVAEPQYAVVVKNNDPDKLGRVKVRFFWQPEGAETPWIRVAYPHAGPNAGFFFIPEVDEEVVVGFESGDAERPFILGSLYNGRNKPNASWASGGNDNKVLRTKGGNTIELIDKKGGEEINIYQENDKSGGNHISFKSGADPSITIFSKDKLKISAKSIVMEATAGSIEFKAANKIQSKADNEISAKAPTIKQESDLGEIKTSMGLDLKSDASIKVEGKMSVELKGNMEAKLEGGAMTTIKGGMVMIN